MTMTDVEKSPINFRGSTFILAGNVVSSFEIYSAKLIYFTNSNSTVLTTSSIDILQALSKLKEFGKSALLLVLSQLF